MNQFNEPSFLTIAQTAKAFQVSERTIFSLLSSGQLASIKIGAARRIPLAEVTRLAASGVAEVQTTR